MYSSHIWRRCFKAGELSDANRAAVGRSFISQVLSHGGSKDVQEMLLDLLQEDTSAEWLFEEVAEMANTDDAHA